MPVGDLGSSTNSQRTFPSPSSATSFSISFALASSPVPPLWGETAGIRQMRLRAATMSSLSRSTSVRTLSFTRKLLQKSAYRKSPRSSTTSATRWMAAMVAARRIVTFLASA